MISGLSGFSSGTTSTRTVEKRGNTVRTRIQLRDHEGNDRGSISITKTEKSGSGKKKRFPYNHKEISAQLMRTKTPGEASRVAARARRRVAQLMRSKKNSEYDEAEIEAALLHAEQMERVARKRRRNLEVEEQAERGIKRTEIEEMLEGEEDAQGSRQLMVCSVTVEKKKSPEVTDEDIDNWFSNSVIAGNSISLGYEYYLDELQDSFMSDTVHLSASCYSILNDSKEVSGNSLHPVLDGVKRKISDHVRFLTPDKVFLCFGMNDLNIYGPAGAAEQYGAFMDELHNAAPDAQIYVFSMTPVKYSSGNLTPAGITEFNDMVRKYTKKNDYASYIDFYSGMVDDWGFLKGQYCSDGFCHLTNSAYNYWSEVLKDYATQQIIREIKAEDAVDTYVESKDASQLNKAKKQVSKLANAALRSSLETKLG